MSKPYGVVTTGFLDFFQDAVDFLHLGLVEYSNKVEWTSRPSFINSIVIILVCGLKG